MRSGLVFGVAGDLVPIEEADAVWLSGRLWARAGHDRAGAIGLARRIESRLVESDPTRSPSTRPTDGCCSTSSMTA